MAFRACCLHVIPTRRATALADSMLAEYCDGLGDALVSGRITPGRIAISRRDLVWLVEAIPEDEATNEKVAVLLDEHVAKLVEYALALEAAFGGPQDIEWTVSEEERLFLLQSRPIVDKMVGPVAHVARGLR